jgi:hypothetical protein
MTTPAPGLFDRDFAGYGMNRPDPKWPKGAKIAVQCEWR